MRIFKHHKAGIQDLLSQSCLYRFIEKLVTDHIHALGEESGFERLKSILFLLALSISVFPFILIAFRALASLDVIFFLAAAGFLVAVEYAFRIAEKNR